MKDVKGESRVCDVNEMISQKKNELVRLRNIDHRNNEACQGYVSTPYRVKREMKSLR